MNMLKGAFTFAIRVYPADLIGRVMCRDRLVRTPRGKFYLIEEPAQPGELEVVKAITLSDVFDWYRIEPWQIERTIIGATPCPMISNG